MKKIISSIGLLLLTIGCFAQTTKTTVITKETSTTVHSKTTIKSGSQGKEISVNEPVHQTTIVTTKTTYNSGNLNSLGCSDQYAMSSLDFLNAKRIISDESLDNTKLSTATKVINTNCLTSEQIKELMLLFSFEDTRLKLAKKAYSSCVDKSNYFIVNDAFEFSSSVKKLNESIK